MDEKVIKELEELYADVEGWGDEERQSHIRFAYNSIMAQREAQAKYGAVDANDPVAVQAAMEQRMAENGGTVNKIKGASVSGAAAGNTGAAGSNVTSGAVVVQNTVDKAYEAAAKNVESSVDAAAKAAVAEVEAAKAEAEAEYQSQRDAVAVQAANDADNSALYAELRGDSGGIGRAQYDSIRNTAAKNHAEINRAQTAMARTAAAEIAGLQAKGEYEKAERLLDLAQERMAALMEMEQWSAEYAADMQELQAKLSQWQAEYELSAAKITGVTASGAATAETTARLAALGEAMLKKGLMPSAAQLDAMGMTAAQAREYISALKEQN